MLYLCDCSTEDYLQILFDWGEVWLKKPGGILPFLGCCDWSRPREPQRTNTAETSDWTIRHKGHQHPFHFHRCSKTPPTRRQTGLNRHTYTQDLIRVTIMTQIQVEHWLMRSDRRHSQALKLTLFMLFFAIIAFTRDKRALGGRVTGNNVDRKKKVPGVSTAVRAHNTHRQSSTCWRWSLRTFAGLSARPLPPSAPPCPSGQKQTSHVSQHPTKTTTVISYQLPATNKGFLSTFAPKHLELQFFSCDASEKKPAWKLLLSSQPTYDDCVCLAALLRIYNAGLVKKKKK